MRRLQTTWWPGRVFRGIWAIGSSLSVVRSPWLNGAGRQQPGATPASCAPGTWGLSAIQQQSRWVVRLHLLQQIEGQVLGPGRRGLLHFCDAAWILCDCGSHSGMFWQLCACLLFVCYACPPAQAQIARVQAASQSRQSKPPVQLHTDGCCRSQAGVSAPRPTVSDVNLEGAVLGGPAVSLCFV
jgi:hypothetical protein